jgi:hypothetical protein
VTPFGNRSVNGKQWIGRQPLLTAVEPEGRSEREAPVDVIGRTALGLGSPRGPLEALATADMAAGANWRGKENSLRVQGCCVLPDDVSFYAGTN